MISKKKLCADWRLYVITTGPWGTQLIENARQAVAGGADALQLRDKDLDDRALVEAARALLEVTRPAGVPLIINDRPQVARDAGADGVHLGQEDGPLAPVRKLLGPSALIGRSTHTPEQGAAAQAEGFDYIGVGPVFATPTKPDYPPAGLSYVRWASENLTVPFVAIGGIDRSNVSRVLEAGARAVAVVRAVMGSDHPRESAAKIKEVVHGYRS